MADSTAYTRAAICRLGHTVTRDLAEGESPRRCPQCGASVIASCIYCDAPVRGPGYALRQGLAPPQLVKVWAPGGYAPPLECDSCGRAHPWARHARGAEVHR